MTESRQRAGRRPCRVLIVEDVVRISRILASQVEALEGFELVGDPSEPVTTVHQAIAAFDNLAPIDLVLLDLNIPLAMSTSPNPDDGVGLGELIHQRFPETKIVVVTKNPYRNAVTRCQGFTNVIVEKDPLLDESLDVLGLALDAALRDRKFIYARDEPLHSHDMILKYNFTGYTRGAHPEDSREWEVIELLHDGLSNRDICRRLHIANKTLEKHLASIGQKVARVDGIEIDKKEGRTAPAIAREFARTKFDPALPVLGDFELTR